MLITRKLIIEIASSLVYLALLLLGLGFYWVFTGDALQKYFWKRTNFAEFTEPMGEFPTIKTWIDSNTLREKYEFGEDFNISFSSGHTKKEVFLKVGLNVIPGIPLQLNVEVLDKKSLQNNSCQVLH